MNVLVIFATFFAYLSPYVNPIRFWQFSFFGLIYPWLLLFNFLFVGFWIFRKKKYFLFSLGCILLGWGQMKSFVGLNFFGKSDVENSIKIGSYNISGLMYIWEKKSRAEGQQRIEELVEFIKEENIQILCTQETTRDNVNFIKKELGFPHTHYIPYKASVIFSKFPLLKTGEIDLRSIGNNCVWADVKIENQITRIYSAHLQSNKISTIADKVFANGDLRSKETLKDIKGILGKYRYFTKKRAEQSKLIADHISQSPHPVILCGDLNDPPQSFTYRTLTKNLIDTFKERGRGIGTTYAGNIPALRIDYILTDKKINIHNIKIPKENFSDHYPVICKISF